MYYEIPYSEGRKVAKHKCKRNFREMEYDLLSSILPVH